MMAMAASKTISTPRFAIIKYFSKDFMSSSKFSEPENWLAEG
jgi:hypothetical protein